MSSERVMRWFGKVDNGSFEKLPRRSRYKAS